MARLTQDEFIAMHKVCVDTIETLTYMEFEPEQGDDARLVSLVEEVKKLAVVMRDLIKEILEP